MVTRWDPFRDLMGIQNEMNRLFGRTYGNESGEFDTRGAWAPAMDIYETPDKFAIVMELPGMNSGDVDITVEDGILSVSGERKFYSDLNEDSFHRIERRYGSFQRRITLPSQADSSKVDASMNNGTLKIEVGKAEQAKPKRIEVKATEG